MNPHNEALSAAPLAAQRVRLALFDLDHTLIPLDSDYAWGQFTVGLGWRDADSFTRANDSFYAHYKAGTLDIAEYVRFATGAVREHGRQQAQVAHHRFMQEVILPALRESALDLVRAHQAAGDEVLIVTA
ncbi:MAG: haloacid dehalogenase-like hydrolase, partial [Hydrogenophaga sp.]|nr:haloacid dehalogenase-like hydrolase [Hydrogenophaga sp.]